MEAKMTSEKLQEIVIWVAAHEDIVEFTAKVRDKRLVYRPITEEDGHWGRVIEQRTLRTTTIDLLTGEILGTGRSLRFGGVVPMWMRLLLLL